MQNDLVNYCKNAQSPTAINKSKIISKHFNIHSYSLIITWIVIWDFPCQNIVDLRTRMCRDESLSPGLRFLQTRIKVSGRGITLSLKNH